MVRIEERNFSGREPNIEKLKLHIAQKGNVIKNYKELCEILEISRKTNTDRKKKQMERLMCYFNYAVCGYRIIIEEIFDRPKKTISHERSTYGADMESAILNRVLESEKQDESGYKVLYINMKELCEWLGFVNADFNRYKYNKLELKKRAEKLFEYYNVSMTENNILKMGTDALIEYIYDKVYLQITQTVKRNLQRLEKNQVIQCEPVYEYHPEGVPYTVKWYIEANGDTHEQYSVIEACRVELMAEMKEEINSQRRKKGKKAYSKFNMSHIFIYGREEEYFKRLNELYKAKLDKCFGNSPKYIVPAYKISLHPIIKQKLRDDENFLEVAGSAEPMHAEIRLNNKVLKKTYDGFKNRHNRIVGYNTSGFCYIDKKTGEICHSKDNKIDRDSCYDEDDLKRLKIIQRIIFIQTNYIRETVEDEYEDFTEEGWFRGILLDGERPLENFFDPY